MGIVGDVINYIIDMGASAMLPLVIAILSIIVGVKVGKAVRAGLMVGVGFVGLDLIVTLMNDNLGPAAQKMSENFGLSLNVVDIGWPGMSPITWASSIATVAIPIAIAVNVLMLILKLTKTVNVDIWNIWHMTFTGAIAYAVTGNFAIGIAGVIVHAIFSYKFGDLYAPLMEDYFDLESITVPHGTATYLAPIACTVDAIIDKIPGLNKIDFSLENLQEKVGVLAEPIVIGGILGGIVGLLAGYDFAGAFQLAIKMSAVMVLMPKITKCIMEGLMPLSERMKEILTKRSGDSEFYIGLDPAILLGDSDVVTAGLIFIPLTLLIAVIVPGNVILPFGDLATIGFFIAIAVAVHKGNLFRTLISGSCIMFLTIWIANQAIPWTTALAQSVNLTGGASQIAALDQGGCPITYLFTQLFTQENMLGFAVIGVLYIICMVFTVRLSKKRAAALKEENY
ncbi:MAG TPA: PTS galactitol transporter subunit IIC [Candidatus Anaerostipes excrementavium]|uniref:PTS galactitol transporter subunit IIC n=1 Tax=Candidatus Anaerostipes excrementavium TaxID=2838463 RepID=A0A9D1WTL7_9FIRM|nr:PTS transporter subunit IIC [uncultured Anaerostipes sp.]HIX66570.1 PTS galactitol transporter subunit IIC [Candidatus Anaerostipes excrementavium]